MKVSPLPNAGSFESEKTVPPVGRDGNWHIHDRELDGHHQNIRTKSFSRGSSNLNLERDSSRRSCSPQRNDRDASLRHSFSCTGGLDAEKSPPSIVELSTYFELFQHNIWLIWSLGVTWVLTGLALSGLMVLRWKLELEEVNAPCRVFAFMFVQMLCWSFGVLEFGESSGLTIGAKLMSGLVWFGVTMGSAAPLFFAINMDVERWNMKTMTLAQMGPYFVGLLSTILVGLCSQEQRPCLKIMSFKATLMIIWIGFVMVFFIVNLEFYFIGAILMRNQPFYLEMLYSSVLPMVQSASSRVMFVHFLVNAVTTIIELHNPQHLERVYVRNTKFCLKLPTVVALGLMESWWTFMMSVMLSMTFEGLGVVLNYLVYIRLPETSMIGRFMFKGQARGERKEIFVRYFAEEEYAEKVIVTSSVFIFVGFNVNSSSEKLLFMVLLRCLVLVLVEIAEDVMKHRMVDSLTGLSINKMFPVFRKMPLQESLGMTVLLTATCALLLMGEVIASQLI